MRALKVLWPQPSFLADLCQSGGSASYSRREEEPERLREFVAALDHVSEDLKGDNFHFANGFAFIGAVGHNTREVRHGGEDAAILFPLDFDADGLNGHHCNFSILGRRWD